jgi:dUTP pyrophosphatase
MHKLLILPLSEEVREFYLPLCESDDDSHIHKGDSGIDIYMPEDLQIPSGRCQDLIKLGFKAKMINESGEAVSWLLMPRSSIYKTPFRMSNSLGLIDAGYRGELRLPLDNIASAPWSVEKGTRLVQAVAPGLDPIKVELVQELDDTTRGEDGFGSTGA